MTLSIFQTGLFNNMKLIFAIIGSLSIQFLLLYLPFTQIIFKVQPLFLKEILIVLAVSTLPLWIGPFQWDRAAGETIKLSLNKHPFSESLIPSLNDFTKLTGIKVDYSVLSEEEYRAILNEPSVKKQLELWQDFWVKLISIEEESKKIVAV